MAKKSHVKVRLVPEAKPDSAFYYYVKKPSGGEKAKVKLKARKYNPSTRKHEIFVEKNYGPDKVISSTFVRLSDSTPIIKLEFLGGKHDNDEIKSIMNKLFKTSIGGYPYALKLAHNNCKISDKELGKMVSLLGLSNEIGSREVLG